MREKTFNLRIDLLGIKPPVWRRFKLNGDTNFLKFHETIQVLMGWYNYHLFGFETEDLVITDDLELPQYSRQKVIKPVDIKVGDVLKQKGDKIVYTYDYGDDWEHLIKVEEIEEGIISQSAICLKGKRNCPPEDCGGPYGYFNMLNVIKDPSHPEYEEILEWLGGDFDPEYFDLTEINQELSDLF